MLPPLQGIQEGLDASLPDAQYSPLYAPAIKNVRVAPGKVSTRRGISLWQTLPGVGRVRLLDNLYTAAGGRIRLAARGNGGSATLYDYVEGTDTTFNATSGGTSLGGTTDLRFNGVELNDTYYFTDRYGALRKYQESPSSGNQVRSVALPTKPSAAPGVKPKTYETLEGWAGNGGAAPYGWTVSDSAKFDIEDGTGSGGYEAPIGGQVVLLNTKTNPKNSPITENVTAEAVPSTTIAFWINATNIPTQIAFQYGLVVATDYTESLSPPVKSEWHPVFVAIGNIGTINYKRFIVLNNAGAADTYVSKLMLPGRLQGAYRWRYSHYDPTLLRESALSDASLSNTPLDLSAIGVTGKPATAAAFQKSAAVTFTSDSGTDATTTKVRVYRSGGVPALTKDGRGIDVWCRVGEVYDYSSTLSAGPAAGATSISVTSATNLAVGDWLVIEKGTVSKEEYVRITVIVGTTLTISNGLQYAHSNGVAIQMAFVDNVPNEQVDLSTRIYVERDDPPAAAKWIARSPDGRIWLANYSGKPTGVRVSNRATPDRTLDYEVFPNGVDPITRRDPLQGWDFEVGGDSTDEEITWLGFYMDRPYVFTKSRLYAINAMSQTDWGPYAVVPALQLGCINGDTVKEMDGWLTWVTDGPRVMRWDGRGALEEVSHLRVNERLEGAPTEDWDQWFAVAHARRDGHAYNLCYTPGDESGLINPSGLTALWLDLDATRLSGNQGDAIGTFTDQVAGRSPTAAGSARATLQVTSNLSPTGRQLLRFDGVNDQYSWSGTMPSVQNGWTIIIACNLSHNSNNGTELFGDDTDSRPQLFVDTNTTPRGYGQRADATLPSRNFGVFAAGFQVLAWVFNPPAGTGVCEVWKNNVSLGSAVWTFNPASSGGVIVSGSFSGNIFALADYGRILLITQALDEPTLRGPVAWLMDYFGTS